MTRQIVIIGNGIAGITAARHIRKRSDDPITVISAESDHFFSRTALMYIYMGHMRYRDTKPYEDRFWGENRIALMRARVESVDAERRRLALHGGEEIAYDVLVIASGSRSNKFGWPGQDLAGVQGLYSLQDLETMEASTGGIDRGVIVGGGLIGVETAEMLASRGIAVTFLVREKSWMEFAFPAAESTMIGRHIAEHGIDLRLATELDRIEPDAAGRVRSVVTKDGQEIACRFVALTVGVGPNIAFLDGSGIETDRGVLVDDHLRTSASDVYAAGDCVQLRDPAPGRRPIEPVWYTGRAMGQTVARNICGEPAAYDQGIWFNSAKFFDLEWQVYGTVPAHLGDDHDTLFWQDSGGKKAIRIVYRKDDMAVTGFNLMGVRYRHEICHEWLRDERPLPWVLEHLGAANFDPELCRQHEAEVVAVYNRRHPERPVKLAGRRGLRSLLAARRAS